MYAFSPLLHVLPLLMISLAFLLGYAQYFVEKRIEEQELDRRAKRENVVNLKKYFKKKEDTFDKIAYLGDLYKVMQEYLNRINKMIEENERAVAEQDDPNVRKMLKQKYSVHDKLEREGKLKQIAEMQTDIRDILENLRTKDGRSLMDLYKQNEIKKQLAIDEERLRALNQKKDQDTLDEIA